MNFSEIFLGAFSIKTYGIFGALAFLLASIRFYRRLQKDNQNISFFIHHFWRWVTAGLLLGRVFSLATYPQVFDIYGFTALFAFWENGIHLWGAGLGFLGMAAFDLKKHNLSWLQWFDDMMPPLLFGLMIIDFGAFLSGAQYGTQTSFFWGIRYETFGVDILSPVHPVPLYALFFHFIIYKWCQKNFSRYKNFEGKLFIRSFIWIVFIDFWLQFLRADQTVYLYDMRLEQAFDIITFFGLLFFQYRKKYLS